MRKMFENAIDRLRGFLTQSDNLALVVGCNDGEVPVILKMLETIEEECAFALFWQFPEPFTTAQEYVQLIQENFSSKHELVRLLQQQEGMAVWPELPAELSSESLSPQQRLQTLMVFARSLIPTLNGGLLVWVMVPGDIADKLAYAQLMRDLLQHDWPFPWCHHMRIILRRDPACPLLPKLISDIPRIDSYAPDFSTQAMQNALEEEVDDESLPLEERLQSLLLTAGSDQAHRRYALALQKYQLLFEHYSFTGNLPLAAVALNGMGEAYRDQLNPVEAGACFEAAVVAATDGAEQSTPVLLNAFLNLGNLRMQENRWSEAEIYYDCAQKTATILRYADTKIMILEQLGESQSMQNKHAEAIYSWQAGAIIAAKLEKPELRDQHVKRLRAHWGGSDDSPQLREFLQQLAATEPATAAS